MRTAVEQANFDLISSAIDRITEKYCTAGYEQLSEVEKTVYCVWWVEAEVNNGGFHQYFWNSAGDHCADAAPSLRRIGAPKMAAIVQRAVETFLELVSPTREARCEQLEGLSEEDLEALGGLDDEFYAYPENLEVLLADFIRRSQSLA